MGQALYRKYRSKSLSEIVGQEHITKTLSQAVKSGRLSHAYLFTGPRGVGKTSIARILAHDINGLPYADDSSHIDIIEIDAASNRKLEETKELIEKVYVAPISAKYKIYIIDEVHMLTKESFNALLKTLEEPPSHVIFILATTEAHKLPETIISRTQRFQFKPIDQSKVVSHLKTIAKNEGIKIDDEALGLIAKHGQGSFRDSISLLEQTSNYNNQISAETIRLLLGIPPDQLLEELIKDLEAGSVIKVTSTLGELIEQGYLAASIASLLSSKIRELLIANKPLISYQESLKLLENLLDVPASYDPNRLLEICLIKAMPIVNDPAPTTKPEQTNNKSPKNTGENNLKVTDEPIKDKAIEQVRKSKTPSSDATTKPLMLDAESWQEVLNLLKSNYNTLYGVVRMASVDFIDQNSLKLSFAFPFHQKRVSESKNRDIIQKAINQITGNNVSIECVVDENLLSTVSQNGEGNAGLETINSIFGESSVLE